MYTKYNKKCYDLIINLVEYVRYYHYNNAVNQSGLLFSVIVIIISMSAI